MLQYYFKCLRYAIWIATCVELLMFPELDNIVLCTMSIICTEMYIGVTTHKILLSHPFSYFAYTTLFMYRYLPLFATLFEGNPISIGFTIPYQTAIGELVLFAVATVAFYLAAHKRDSEGLLVRIYNNIGVFRKYRTGDYWFLGFWGLFIGMIALLFGNEFIYKLLASMGLFRYAPICLLFPSLTGCHYKKKRHIYLWIVVLFCMGIPSGSREVILSSILTFLLLTIINYSVIHIKNKLQLFHRLLGFSLVGLLIIFPILNTLSTAMLLSRNTVLHGNASKVEIFNEIVNNTLDTKKIQQKQNQMVVDNDDISFDEWNESYVSNTFLNRYANLRLSDETLKRANYIGWGHPVMLNRFLGVFNKILPSGIMAKFGVHVDPNAGSNGDVLFALSTHREVFASAVVTSHLGDGMATFGLLYFPLQLIIWFMLFRLVDSLILRGLNGNNYSLGGLCSVFLFFGITRASGGCAHDLFFCVKGFWFTILGIFLMNIILRLKYYLQK